VRATEILQERGQSLVDYETGPVYWGEPGTRTYDIPPERIATIGDMPNDVLMFAHSGLSIAMGNASHEVQRAARRVTTTTNDDEGFANAAERFILP
jgi:hydroxymethylpyrimidine pyrophosphatase-like HAD family hydrolase